jgi:hypothetical protein
VLCWVVQNVLPPCIALARATQKSGLQYHMCQDCKLELTMMLHVACLLHSCWGGCQSPAATGGGSGGRFQTSTLVGPKPSSL